MILRQMSGEIFLILRQALNWLRKKVSVNMGYQASQNTMVDVLSKLLTFLKSK